MKSKRKQYSYKNESVAHNVRRALIKSGTEVSLIAYNPNTENYVFDAYIKVKDADDE